MKRAQEVIHWLEVGAGARGVRLAAVLVGTLALSLIVAWKQFHGPVSETTLLQADTGRVALHGAAHKGATEVVKLLVAAGARMDVRDFGNTDNRGSTELSTRTWLPIDYADGLVRVGVQSAIAHPETAKVLRELMQKAGLEAPPEGRTLESLCIVEVCRPGYDPVGIND